MRAIRIAAKTIAPLAVVGALMALPSMSAASMYWGEYDYQPLGGSPTSEDPVTADFTGTITLDDYPNDVANLTCQVAGEIRLANDWDHPSGTDATNEIVSIAPAQSVAQSCTGSLWGGTCHVTDVTFSGLSWDGVTDSWTSGFSDLSITTKYKSAGCASAPNLVVEGDITTAYPYLDGGQGDCLTAIEIAPEQLTEELPAYISGLLELDLNSLEGLSTNDGGPCVTLNTN